MLPSLASSGDESKMGPSSIPSLPIGSLPVVAGGPVFSGKLPPTDAGLSAPDGPQSARVYPVQRQSVTTPTMPATARPSIPDDSESLSSGKPAIGQITPAQALRFYVADLSEYEQGEILEYKSVYCLGSACKTKIRANTRAPNNHGFDDERGDYKIILRDHLSYRYEIMDHLGKGSFGQVVKCMDHATGQMVAVKVIRNKKRFHHQALIEVKLLTQLRDRDPTDAANIIHLKESFYFRHHLCISFPLLSINLYEFIKNNNFQGVSLGLIRRFAIQMLTTLRYLRMQKVVHCDLKPENVLLKQPNKSGIKIIDFGSSCLEHERVYTYIQSRFYRAPEVILGLPYGMPIDVWSFACILAELLTGYPLFPGENEVEQLACVMEVLGLPPPAMIAASTRKKQFFELDGTPKIVPNSRGKKRRPGSKDLGSVLRCGDASFVSFLEGCLAWDPEARFTPDQAFQHPWIQDATVPVSRSVITGPSSTGRAPGTAASTRSTAQARRPVKPSEVSLGATGSSTLTDALSTISVAGGAGGRGEGAGEELPPAGQTIADAHHTPSHGHNSTGQRFRRHRISATKTTIKSSTSVVSVSSVVDKPILLPSLPSAAPAPVLTERKPSAASSNNSGPILPSSGTMRGKQLFE